MTPIDPRVETIRLLTSIDASLKAIAAAVLHFNGQIGKNGSGATADDADLDSPKGDEVVKFQPRDWSGESFKGAKMSACPPEFLTMYADSCDYFAQKNDERGEKTDRGTPKSTFDRRTARRARGWAARLRGGWTPPQMDDQDTWKGDGGGF